MHNLSKEPLLNRACTEFIEGNINGFQTQDVNLTQEQGPHKVTLYFLPITLAKIKSLIILDKELIPLVYKVFLQMNDEKNNLI